jgi:osmoprotectant transport system ATP-binding protein
MTIAANVATVPNLLGWDKAKTKARVNELLELVGLDPAEYSNRYPKQLSGGQQQRVGVARALAADPAVLLMDEPFGATDPITRVRLQKEFRALQRELKKTVVFVTHDFEEALLLGDRIAVLSEQSHVEQYGTPLEILSAPATDRVKSFVGEAASVRMLGLVSLKEIDVLAGANGTVTVPETGTLREAMEQFIGGADVINIGTRGHLTFDALQNVIAKTRSTATHS